MQKDALPGVAQCIEHWLVNQRVTRSQVRFLVRAHAWVVGQVPGGGNARGKRQPHIDVSFPLLLPPFPSF